VSFDPSPQARQMADPSMLRNLDAQARAIWPQEAPLLDRYGLRPGSRVLDVGSGPGEIASRIAERHPDVRVTAVDLIEEHLALGASRYADLASRIGFVRGDAYALPFPDGAFDLAVCRHVLQAVPDAPRAIGELVRVTRPGGFLHLLAEDYGMIHVHPVPPSVDTFWSETVPGFGRSVGTDLHVGRRAFTHLRRLGLEEVRVDWIVVDTVRVPRETFATILEAWRDGYTEALAENTRVSADEVRAQFDAMTAAIRDPDGYAVWHVPIVSGRVPARPRS
jgi:ubiquinone/menaquinone biosynthesis C-methylase UbiE